MNNLMKLVFGIAQHLITGFISSLNHLLGSISGPDIQVINWTRSLEENFGVNLLYAKILALLLVWKSHVTTLLLSDWFKFSELRYATPK